MTEAYHSEQLRGDDVFANSSNETVVENIDYSLVLKEAGEFLNTQNVDDVSKNQFPITSAVKDDTTKVEEETHISSVNRSLFTDNSGQVDVSFTVNQLIVHTSNLPRRLFCPFCTQHYGFEFLLKEHIKKCHSLEIETFVVNSKTFQFHSCPFCEAKFYLADLLTKHVMCRHQECVLNILREVSPQQYVNCRFCPFRVSKKHEKQLLIHVENKHLKSFEAVFTEKYSVALDSKNDVDKSTCGTAKQMFDKLIVPLTIQPSDSPSEYQQSNTGVKKSILKNGRTLEEECHMKNGTDAPYFTARSGAVKRRLHYETCSEDKRENNDTCAIKLVSVGHSHKRSRWKALFKKMRPRSIAKRSFVTSTPYANSVSNKRHFFMDGEREVQFVYSNAVSPAKRVKFNLVENEIETDRGLEEGHGILSNTSNKIQPVVNQSIEIEPALKQFKCGLCLQAFVCNNELLNHTRVKHNGPFNLLRPRYRCGECEAKFYKNSYLLRHCKFHHTPLCLRNKKYL